jgi:hypothetical protein
MPVALQTAGVVSDIHRDGYPKPEHANERGTE